MRLLRILGLMLVVLGAAPVLALGAGHALAALYDCGPADPGAPGACGLAGMGINAIAFAFPMAVPLLLGLGLRRLPEPRRRPRG